MLLIFGDMKTDPVKIIRGHFFPVSVFHLKAIFVSIDIPIRNGQFFSSLAIPLRLPYLIPVSVIQGKVIITALRHIYISLDAKIIPLEVRKWDGEVIEIYILFITEASFQAAGLIFDQKV